MLKLRLLGIAAGTLVALTPATALASGGRLTFALAHAPNVAFTTPQNQAIQGSYGKWTAESQEPTVTGLVQIWPASLCQGALGCSEWYKGEHTAVLHATSRDIFYFEMGHLYDYERLTWTERGILTRVWGVTGHGWTNSFKALQDGREDGLAADFAAAYAACSEGEPVAGLQSGDAPEIAMHNTCAIIRKFAA